MQDKDSKSYDQIKAEINKCITNIEKSALLGDPPMLDNLMARRKEFSAHIDDCRDKKLDVNFDLLNRLIDQYQSFLLGQATIWESQSNIDDSRKGEIRAFKAQVSQEIAALQTQLLPYQAPEQPTQDSALRAANKPKVHPVAGFSTVDPLPLPAAQTFIEQLKTCCTGGTVSEKGDSAQGKNYEIKYPTLSPIKKITVTRSETGQVSASTSKPNEKTLNEMLSILEKLEPKGAKALKIDAKDEKTLHTLYDLATKAGHTLDLTDEQKHTLKVDQSPKPD